MSKRVHHRLRYVVARLLCAVLLFPLLVPAGLAPVQAGLLVGADGTVLPTVFCGPRADAGDHPDDHHDARAVDHCVLCRLPGAGSLGIGPLPDVVLPVRSHRQADAHVALSPSIPALRAVPAFAARAPPRVSIDHT